MPAKKKKTSGSKKKDLRLQAFVVHYLRCWNATESARRAGFVGSKATLAVRGSECVRNSKVQAAIQRRLKRAQLSADEILARLAVQATADLSPFIEFDENNDPKVNTKAIIDAGQGHLIKGIEYNKQGLPVVKTHDQQKALDLLGRAAGLFKERHEHSGPDGGPIPVKDVRPMMEKVLTDPEAFAALAMLSAKIDGGKAA